MNDLVGLFAVHPLTIQVKGAFGRLIHTSDQVEHGGFACAVGADQPHQLGFADFHIKIIHGFQAAKLDAKCWHFKTGCAMVQAPFSAFAFTVPRPVSFSSARVRLNSHRPKMPPGRNSMTSTRTTE